MSFWGRYVPVAERRVKARRQMNKLRAKGRDVQPVEIVGRTIASSFWGQGWCEHLESFSDFANRLPRGRAYLRNGSVCHLDIRPGRIEAMVSGSALYEVSIDIRKLKAAAWQVIKQKCAGQIGSMLELLQGRLSDRIMAVVTDRGNGLFPLPGEIKLNCSCPDWARMCKHVAAVLYGVGSRLDQRPDLLFLLRDVDAQELIATEIALPAAVAGAVGETLADNQLGAIFGIDLDLGLEGGGANEPLHGTPLAKSRKTARAAASAPLVESRRKALTTRRRKTAPLPDKTPGSKRTAPSAQAKAPLAKQAKPFHPTGKSVARLRRRLGLSVAQFAAKIGVTAASVYRWEVTAGRLNLRDRPLKALTLLQAQGGLAV